MKRKITSVIFCLILLLCTILSVSASENVEVAYNMEQSNFSVVEKNLNTGTETEITLNNIDFSQAQSLPNMIEPIEIGSSAPISTYSIIGNDDRVLVEDTELYPYSAIVYLEITWNLEGEKTRGTAFMISDDVAVTAAHCLYDAEKGWPIAVKAYPAKNGEYFWNNPYGSSYSSKLGVCTEWRAAINSGNTDDETQNIIKNNDWGAIKLILPLGKYTGTINLKAPTDDEIFNCPIKICGYPKNVYEDEDNSVYQQYEMNGYVSSYTPSRLYYNIDTSGGQSGAPILSENNVAYGIHTYSSSNINFGTRMTENMIYYFNLLIND